VRKIRFAGALAALAAACGARTGLRGAVVDASAPSVRDASVEGDGACEQRPFGAPVAIAELRTPFNESGLRLSPDGLTGWFASDRPGGLGANDFYATSRADLASPFGQVQHLANVSSVAEDWDPTVSGDGLRLLFGSTRAPGDGSDQQLYVASRTAPSSDFGAPAALPLSTLGTQDHQPFLREDGAVVYWSSARSGLWDIYRASASGGVFGAPTPVDELNSAASQEWCPIVTPDDLTVYFATDRAAPGTRGDFDLWVATRASTSEPFSNLEPVSEVNSSGPDLPCFVSADRCTLYVTSNRPGGAGGFDLYVAKR
jgi:hypothetical protein